VVGAERAWCGLFHNWLLARREQTANIASHVTPALEDGKHTQWRQRVHGAPVVPAAKALSNYPLVFLANIPDATTASASEWDNRIFAPRTAATAAVLDFIGLGRPAIVDTLRPPSTTRQDYADLGSSHGQNAIRTVEGKSVGDPAELGCSESADALILLPPFRRAGGLQIC